MPVANASWRRPRAPAPGGLTEIVRSGSTPAALPRSLTIFGQDVPPAPQPPAPQPVAQDDEDDYLKRIQREATQRLHAGTAPPNVRMLQRA